jgi:hypothetical protein
VPAPKPRRKAAKKAAKKAVKKKRSAQDRLEEQLDALTGSIVHLTERVAALEARLSRMVVPAPVQPMPSTPWPPKWPPRTGKTTRSWKNTQDADSARNSRS